MAPTLTHLQLGDPVEKVVAALEESGAVIVEGTVDGDVIVIDGTATVSGTVEGSVIVVRGTAEITDSGTVEGDVVGQKLEIDTGATIGGDQTDLGLSFDAVVDSVRESARALLDRLAFFFWLSSTVSYLLLGLVLVWLAPSALHRSVESARRLVGESIAWGVALLIVLPLVSVLLVLTRVGFPFGVGLFLALCLAYALGYVVAAAALGQAVLRRHDRLMVPFLLGWAILRLVALIPIAGIIIWALSAVYGLGAIAMAAQRAQSDADRNRAGVSLGT